MAMETENEIMTTYQAARRLGVTHNAIIQAIRDKRLPATRHGLHRRGAWEINARDLERYAARAAAARKPGRPRADAARDQLRREARLISLAELARQLGVSRWRAEQLMRAGVIRPALAERRRYLFPAEAVAVARRHLAARGPAGTLAGTPDDPMVAVARPDDARARPGIAANTGPIGDGPTDS